MELVHGLGHVLVLVLLLSYLAAVVALYVASCSPGFVCFFFLFSAFSFLHVPAPSLPLFSFTPVRASLTWRFVVSCKVVVFRSALLVMCVLAWCCCGASLPWGGPDHSKAQSSPVQRNATAASLHLAAAAAPAQVQLDEAKHLAIVPIPL